MYKEITKYMSRREVKQQLIMLAQAPIESVNYEEFLEMFHFWEKPMHKFEVWWDLEDENLKLITKRLKELEFYYK